MSITQTCAEETEALSILWSEALPPTGREGELRRSDVTRGGTQWDRVLRDKHKEHETFEWIDRQLDSGG